MREIRFTSLLFPTSMAPPVVAGAALVSWGLLQVTEWRLDSKSWNLAPGRPARASWCVSGEVPGW